MFEKFAKTLTFDDVLLVPQYSNMLPKDADTRSNLTAGIELQVPFLSAPMDTVTEGDMAIAMALTGGIGVIHKNLSVEAQQEEVRRVKRFENGFIENPATVLPDDLIEMVIAIREKYGYKKLPVVDEMGHLVGLISDSDYFIAEDAQYMVRERMRPASELVLAREGITLDQANNMIREFRLRTLCVVDEERRIRSMVTRKDIEKNQLYPQAAKDENKQLLVGAATSVGEAGIVRGQALIQAGVDVLVVDTAHGHSKGVIDAVKVFKHADAGVQIIAGNIATGDAALALIDAGVDAVKVGIGPGSICTTRVVAGIGVPQLSAIMDVVKAVRTHAREVPVIADGGIKTSGDVVKALAAGASTVMMGNMFAGTDESPGRVEFIDGRMYKTYRGMGSMEAMEQGSKDRYGQADIKKKQKFVPEGVSARVPYKGQVDRIIYQLTGGLKAGMGYNGAPTIATLHERARFVSISGSSLKESHPHDLGRIEDSPNYSAS